ncbi:hypothetical protein ACH4FX_42645 [Streptomyces sp. NPDC018019]|uniref:hypothetical protein n=1 Tax=Streptomyces sp. NPDC018019 TaxID=3365030 RepID=UPI00378CD70F
MPEIMPKVDDRTQQIVCAAAGGELRSGTHLSEVDLWGVRVALAYRLDEAEHERRIRSRAGSVDDLWALNALLKLPVGEPVPASLLNDCEHGLLRGCPPGVLRRRGSTVERLAVLPLWVDLAVVRSEHAGLDALNRMPFGTYAPQAIWLDCPVEGSERLVAEAELYSTGVVQWQGDGVPRVLAAPQPLRDVQTTAAGWRFTEHAYQQVLGGYGGVRRSVRCSGPHLERGRPGRALCAAPLPRDGLAGFDGFPALVLPQAAAFGTGLRRLQGLGPAQPGGDVVLVGRCDVFGAIAEPSEMLPVADAAGALRGVVPSVEVGELCAVEILHEHGVQHSGFRPAARVGVRPSGCVGRSEGAAGRLEADGDEERAVRERIETGEVGADQRDAFDAGDESAQPQSGALVGEHSVGGAEGECFDVRDAVEGADEESDVVVLVQPLRVERDDEHGRGRVVLLHAADG